jgi:hypothetical protein
MILGKGKSRSIRNVASPRRVRCVVLLRRGFRDLVMEGGSHELPVLSAGV